MKKPELLAPAGNFQIGIAALESGADAIYVGLKSFSARKSATNVDLQELLRLKNYAVNHDKKIYVTLNTIIKEDEYLSMASVLRDLSDAEVDSIIIQDIGLLKFIKSNFPKLVIHASTQMAIHNIAGVELMQKLGVKRVVLSRELTLDEIATIKKNVPEVELEVFIHGALCYSFSGMCLASGLILNRSGNRGECAQICRSYFNQKEQQKYFFSCNDLCVGSDVLKLRDIGVTSLKIEGRMKSKEYVQKTITLYRKILDEQNLKKEEYQELLDQSALTFARKRTFGYLGNKSGDALINNEYPGHLGISAGKVCGIKGAKTDIELTYPVKVFDTIMFLRDNPEVVRHTILKLYNFHGKEIRSARAGEIVQVELQREGEVARGNQVFITQAGNCSTGSVDYKKYPMFKKKIDCDLVINETTITLRCEEFVYEKKDLALTKSREERSFVEVFQSYLDQSAELTYQLFIKNFINQSGMENIFLPPSVIKKIKNEIYSEFSNYISNKHEVYQFAMDGLEQIVQEEIRSWVAKRANLNPRQGDIPFAFLDDITSFTLAQKDNFVFIPMMPILPIDEEIYFRAIAQCVSEHPDFIFQLGINNLSHLKVTTYLSGQKNVSYFLDIFTYVASKSALAFYKEQLSDILFSYNWVEDGAMVECGLDCLIKVSDKSSLPIFVSRGCYNKHNIFGGDCPNSCPKFFTNEISNGKRKYVVKVRECLTFVFC